jgi:hypothetical protein
VLSGGDVALVAVEKTTVQQQYDTFYDGFGGWRRFGGFGESTTTVDNYKVSQRFMIELNPFPRPDIEGSARPQYADALRRST